MPPNLLQMRREKPLLDVVVVRPPDRLPEPPDGSRKKLQKLTIADLIPELMAPTAPVSDGATAPPRTYLTDLNLFNKVDCWPGFAWSHRPHEVLPARNQFAIAAC